MNNFRDFFYFFLFFVQECIAETQDWRQCQEVVDKFRTCMKGHMEEQRKKYLDK